MIIMTQMKLLNPLCLKKNESRMFIIGVVTLVFGVLLAFNSWHTENVLTDEYERKTIIEQTYYVNNMKFDIFHGLYLSPLIGGVITVCISLIDLPEINFKKYLKWKLKKGKREYKERFKDYQ